MNKSNVIPAVFDPSLAYGAVSTFYGWTETTLGKLKKVTEEQANDVFLQ